jgi:hypothetical protein
MPLTDYSDIEQEIKDAPEPKVLPAGTEVNARIISVNSGISDTNDCEWHNVTFDIEDDPLVIEFRQFFWELDREKLTMKQFTRSLNDFQKFAECFSLDYSRPFSWEDDLPGLTGWMILGYKKDDEFGDKNTVKKYVLKK